MCAFACSSARAMLIQPSDVELRLSGIPAARRKSVAQKHQLCASLLIRLRPPQSAMSSPIEHDHDSDHLSLASSGECRPYLPKSNSHGHITRGQGSF